VEKTLDYYIYIFDDEAYPQAVAVAKKLRSAGFSVAVELGEKSLKEAFEYILKIGTRYLIIIGKKELERGVVKIRDLQKREEYEKPINEL
jgi:histidyl-tRNA synthetase